MTNAELIQAAMMINGIEEPAHTYTKWKQLGFQVRKGEKAAFKTSIWKHTTKVVERDGKEEEQGRMFMKTAAFFTLSQVDKVTA